MPEGGEPAGVKGERDGMGKETGETDTQHLLCIPPIVLSAFVTAMRHV